LGEAGAGEAGRGRIGVEEGPQVCFFDSADRRSSMTERILPERRKSKSGALSHAGREGKERGKQRRIQQGSHQEKGYDYIVLEKGLNTEAGLPPC